MRTKTIAQWKDIEERSIDKKWTNQYDFQYLSKKGDVLDFILFTNMILSSSLKVYSSTGRLSLQQQNKLYFIL
jgi:hypothetical protein